MILDSTSQEIIIRFKGKKITFRDYDNFQELLDRIGKPGKTIIHIEMGHICHIDPAAMGMFLQLFEVLDPERHNVKIFNASAVVQEKLDILLSFVRVGDMLERLASTRGTHDRELFAKVLQARTRKILEGRDARNEPAQIQKSVEPGEMENAKKLIISYLKMDAYDRKSTASA
ncbi:MAG: hypothetical protein HW380_2127 [Magnetococcales bacterium]|nr:hypothetical protein [Magnetococcales bacterium]